MALFQEYLGGLKELIDQVSEEFVEDLVSALEEAWKTDKRVLLLGNGGSSSTASHIVADLQKMVQLDTGKALKALCVSDSVPLLTAWANDTEYANVFSKQVSCWAEPGDIVIAISGSGNSPNVIRAVEAGNEAGAITYGLAGYEGGKLLQTAQKCMVVYSRNMQQIEDVHMIALHLIFSILRKRLTPDSGQTC
jgi:D-sedoheptulose 7-phosphate isomerase